MDEHTDDTLERGTRATAVLGITRELIDEQRRTTISLLISAYRSGTATHEALLGGIAELKALDDFEANCENMQTRGNAAAERMHRNG